MQPPLRGPSEGSAAAQTLAFARAYYRCALQPALRRGVPLYAAVLLVWRLVHDALPVERALPRVPGLLPLLTMAWVLAASSVRGVLFGGRQSEYLRSLPTPRPLVTAAMVLGLCFVDLPWVVLCVASRSVGVMVGGPLLSAAAHTALASGRWRSRAAVAVLLAAATVAPAWLIAVPALLVAAHAAPWAWVVTRTGRTSGRSRLHLPVPWLGVARGTLTAVVLADPPVRRRAAGALVLSTGGAALAIVNNDLVGLTSVLHACVVALALTLPLISVRVTTGVIEKGWDLDWLYAATGTGRLTRTLGGIVATVAVGGTMGGLHGLSVALITRPSLIPGLVPLEALAGAGLALMTLGITAAAVKSSMVQPGRLIAGHITATSLAAVTLGQRISLVVLLALSGAAVLVYHARVLRARAA